MFTENLTASESALADLSGLVLSFLPGTWTGRGISQQVRLSRERLGKSPWPHHLPLFTTDMVVRSLGLDAGGGDKAPLVTMAAGPSRSVSLGPLF